MLSHEDLMFFFRVHNPPKATKENVDRILQYFESQPQQLCIKLGAKYGVDPQYFVQFTRQLISFFECHNPRKARLSHVVKIMRAFKSNREGLCRQLQTKYGVDPRFYDIHEHSGDDLESDIDSDGKDNPFSDASSDASSDGSSDENCCEKRAQARKQAAEESQAYATTTESPDSINLFLSITGDDGACSQSASARRTAQWYVEGAWRDGLTVEDAIAHFYDQDRAEAPKSWTITTYDQDWYTPPPPPPAAEAQAPPVPAGAGAGEGAEGRHGGHVSVTDDLLDLDFSYAAAAVEGKTGSTQDNDENRDVGNHIELTPKVKEGAVPERAPV